MTPAQKLKKIKEIYETVSINKNGINTTTHAGHNMAGVIYDIEANGDCDKISLQSLKRIRYQLDQIGRVLGI